MSAVQSFPFELRAQLADKNDKLRRIAAELKTELFGIDAVIDRVIDSVRAWYVLPQLISRPVIVCLWGLTGTGKTQLTRRLAQKLDFYDRFVEVQMDGFSNGSGRHASSISGMLASSDIQEGEPGILVLDEFQRYRTIDKAGDDLKVERYQDVWALLSDGRLAPSLAFMGELESMFANAQYDLEREKSDAEVQTKYKLQLSPWQAKELRQSLKLKEPLMEIMAWTSEQIQARLMTFREQKTAWDTDFSKLLIFVSGNLDEMYRDMARRIEDCDTDADIFHRLTQRLTLIDVKKALGKRFKPEQIARLGNNHVIYPSFSKAVYQKLIASASQQYAAEIEAASGLRFEITVPVLAVIYANAVFPAQGTRPLFSSVHAILSAPLVDAALWALGLGMLPGTCISVGLQPGNAALRMSSGRHQAHYPIALDLDHIKQRANADFRALLAVHEAGHGLVYALLFRRAPQEVKINLASFEGGYNSFSRLKADSRQNCLDMLCVGLAGRAAEVHVFGSEASTTGAEQDLKQATAEAAQFVRHYGFGQRLSRTDVSGDLDDNVNTDVAPSNSEIEALLAEQYQRANALLQTHASLLLAMVTLLLKHGELSGDQINELLGLITTAEVQTREPYAALLQEFAAAEQQRTAQTQAQALMQTVCKPKPAVNLADRYDHVQPAGS